MIGASALLVASLIFAATFILPSLASGPLMFGLFLVLLGATSGLVDVIMNARISALEVASKRSLMNANHGVFSASYAVAAILTGVAREAGWPPIAVFLGAAMVAVALALTTKQELPAEDAEQRVGKASALWPVLLCGAVTLIAFMSEATVESWSALHIERTLLGRAAQGALGPATLGLTMAIGRFGGQAIIEKTSEYTVIIWATVLSIGGVLIAATAATPLVAYLGFGIMGLGISVIGPMALALVGRLVPQDARTQAISKVAVIGFAGFFIAPVLMGLISEGFGLRIAFSSVALLLALAFPLVIAIRRLQTP